MRTHLVAGVLLAGIALVGCSDDDDDGAATTTTTTAEASTTTATTQPTSTTTTEPASATTTPTTAVGGGLPTNPEDYATALIDTWKGNDADFAHELATDEAVDTLFSFESGGPTAPWALQGCEGAAGSTYCTFNAGGDPTVTIRVANEAASLGQPQAVIEVIVET